MAHISSQEVSTEMKEKIYSMLFEALSSKNVTEKQQKAAFTELLTPTEKVMIGKRLVALFCFPKVSGHIRL